MARRGPRSTSFPAAVAEVERLGVMPGPRPVCSGLADGGRLGMRGRGGRAARILRREDDHDVPRARQTELLAGQALEHLGVVAQAPDAAAQAVDAFLGAADRPLK